MLKTGFYIVGVMLACIAGLHAQPVVTADKSAAWMLGHGKVEVWSPPDTGAYWDAQRVSALPDSAWKSPQSRNFYYGVSKQGLWLRFAVINEEKLDPQDMVLEVVNPNLDTILFLLESNGATTTMINGRTIEDAEKNSLPRHFNYQFPFQLKPLDRAQCLLYVRAKRAPLHFNLYLWSAEVRSGVQTVRENVVLTCFFVVIIFYLVVLGIANSVIRFTSLWFYWVYVFVGAIFVSAELGLGYRYLWPGQTYIQQVSQLLLANLYLLAGTQFVRVYFHTSRFHPRFNSLFLVIMGITTALLPFSLVLPLLSAKTTLFIRIVVYAHYSLFMLGCLAFIALFIMAWRKRHRMFSGWFLFGFSLHGIGIFMTILQYMGIMPDVSLPGVLYNWHWPLPLNAQVTMMAGMLLEVPVLLYVAFQRFKFLYEQNARKNDELAALQQSNLNALLLGTETERRRIGQDLHDTLGVQMAAIRMRLTAFIGSNGHADSEALKSILSDMENAQQEIRRISHNLMPKSLYRLGLGPAIDEHIHRLQTLKPELKIDFYSNAPLDKLSQPASMHLYRIISELLANTLKHAVATEVHIQLNTFEGHLLLTIEDNGIGFDLASLAQKQGVGLSNIRHRVELMGGKCNIDSAPGRGVIISIELPAAQLTTGA